MISAALYNAIKRTEMILLWCLIVKIVLKFGFEKRVFNKISFLQKEFHEDFWNGIASFLSTIIIFVGLPKSSQNKHVLPYYSNFPYLSVYESICIVTKGKTRSVPLNILSSVNSVTPQVKTRLRSSSFEPVHEISNNLTF